MPFPSQFAISYGAALLLGTVALTRGGQGTLTIALVYGFVGLPFGLIVGGLSRLSERIIGWPGAIVTMILFGVALYFLAPNKQNYSAAVWMILPYMFAFAVAWSFLSWRVSGVHQ